MGQPGLPKTAYTQYPASAKRPLPPTVRRAVMFMRVGAALAVANGLVMIVLAGQANNSSQAVNSGGSSVNTTAFEAGYIVGYLVWYLALIGLWLWMAQANKAGKNWARITGTTFFGVSCLIVLVNLVADSLAGAGQGGGLAFVALAITGLNWIIGLFTVILLWHKKSAPHFTSMPYPAPGPVYRPVPQSKTTMDGVVQHGPVADPWSTPSSQA
jgi:hypothetical protein